MVGLDFQGIFIYTSIMLARLHNIAIINRIPGSPFFGPPRSCSLPWCIEKVLHSCPFRNVAEIFANVCKWMNFILEWLYTLCTRNLCPGRGDAAGGTRKRENAKTRKRRKRRKRQARKPKTAKTRKRQNAKTRKAESRFCRKQKNITINYRTSNQTKTHGDGKSTKTWKRENSKTAKRVLVF